MKWKSSKTRRLWPGTLAGRRSCRLSGHVPPSARRRGSDPAGEGRVTPPCCAAGPEPAGGVAIHDSAPGAPVGYVSPAPRRLSLSRQGRRPDPTGKGGFDDRRPTAQPTGLVPPLRISRAGGDSATSDAKPTNDATGTRGQSHRPRHERRRPGIPPLDTSPFPRAPSIRILNRTNAPAGIEARPPPVRPGGGAEAVHAPWAAPHRMRTSTRE